MKIITLIIVFALQLIGSPYVYGMTGPEAFDCSGFTYYCYMEAADIELPRTAYDQGYCDEYLKIETIEELETGDLVFFNTNGSGISHVGIYIGNGNMIHSTKPGDVVKTTNINSSYYASKYVTARRIID